ncbi:MAG TPA: MATE family efflux transporter [Roseiflexaceae bacterium]|nr:MATE family efflux transporter [Roseiflexaceae bacterium]
MMVVEEQIDARIDGAHGEHEADLPIGEHGEASGAAQMGDGPRAIQRRVLGLAGPVIGENLLETMLGLVDTLLVAGLGAAAIAGVGSALQVMFFLISMLSALAVGASVLVAQAVGASDTRRASRLARQSLLWSALLSIPLAILGLLLSGTIIGTFGLEPDVAQVATSYLEVTMGTVVVLVALFIGGGVLRGAGDSRTPMVVTAIANVVNVGLAYAMIYGHFGLPALGTVGSAWATFLARALALVLLVGALWRGRNGVSIGVSAGRSWMPSFGVARDVLRIGVPAALEQVLVSSAFFALTIIVAHLGTEVLAAHRIAFNALSLSFLPGIGFGIAATALVGQSVGARRIEEGAAATRIATIWAVAWMSAIALAILIFAEPIMRLYTNDPAVIAAGAAGLRVVALAQPFWGVLFVQSGGLRGTGNTRFPLWTTGGGIWLSVGLSYALIQWIGGGLASVWAGFLILAPFMAALHWWRFRRTVREEM